MIVNILPDNVILPPFGQILYIITVVLFLKTIFSSHHFIDFTELILRSNHATVVSIKLENHLLVNVK